MQFPPEWVVLPLGDDITDLMDRVAPPKKTIPAVVLVSPDGRTDLDGRSTIQAWWEENRAGM